MIAGPKCQICGRRIREVVWRGRSCWFHLSTAAGEKADRDHDAMPREGK